MEDLVGHVEGPAVAGVGVGFCDFGEDVGWGDDGEGAKSGELGEDLEPPWGVVVAARTWEIGDYGFDLDIEVVGAKE